MDGAGPGPELPGDAGDTGAAGVGATVLEVDVDVEVEVLDEVDVELGAAGAAVVAGALLTSGPEGTEEGNTAGSWATGRVSSTGVTAPAAKPSPSLSTAGSRMTSPG